MKDKPKDIKIHKGGVKRGSYYDSIRTYLKLKDILGDERNFEQDVWFAEGIGRIPVSGNRDAVIIDVRVSFCLDGVDDEKMKQAFLKMEEILRLTSDLKKDEYTYIEFEEYSTEVEGNPFPTTRDIIRLNIGLRDFVPKRELGEIVKEALENSLKHVFLGHDLPELETGEVIGDEIDLNKVVGNELKFEDEIEIYFSGDEVLVTGALEHVADQKIRRSFEGAADRLRSDSVEIEDLQEFFDYELRKNLIAMAIICPELSDEEKRDFVEAVKNAFLSSIREVFTKNKEDVKEFALPFFYTLSEALDTEWASRKGIGEYEGIRNMLDLLNHILGPEEQGDQAFPSPDYYGQEAVVKFAEDVSRIRRDGNGTMALDLERALGEAVKKGVFGDIELARSR